MIDSFFGVHPFVLRSGLWLKMRPGEKDLYVYLMEESERRCTREIVATDSQVTQLVGAASRTLCNARKKLQEHGLIQYRSGQGNRYIYQICNPKTGHPYPGEPRNRALFSETGGPPKRETLFVHLAEQRRSSPRVMTSAPQRESRPEDHGVPGIF
jgi:hypothetical protein